jgi:hypothetical protein
MSSFPNMIYGDFGDEKETSSTRIGNLPLGVRMVLPDGRIFAHCKMGAAAATAGYFYSSVAAGTTGGCIAGSALVVDAAAAVGATTVSVTIGASGAVTVNQFADGYLTITAGTVGMGHIYRVISNTVASTLQTACQIVLDPDDAIKVALIASSTLVQVRENPFAGLVAKPAATTYVGNPAGVAPVAIPANYYGWIQRTGMAAAAVSATAQVAGCPLTCDSAEVGVLNELAIVETTSYSHFPVGVMVGAADASKWATVYLTLK